jgi:glycosyltransferase involved in cell wall biosynthesis
MKPSGARLKVVIVMPLAEIRGGGEMMLWQLLVYGRESGVEWTVIFTRDGPMVEQARGLGVVVHVVPAGRMRNPLSFPSAARKIADIAKAAGADVLLGWIATGQLYGGLASWMSGIPAVWYQVVIPPEKGLIDNAATRLPAVGIITLSKEGQAAQERLKPQRPTTIVYPGVELEKFDPAQLPTPRAAREKLGLPADVPIFGIVGRLQRWKGIHTVIDAAPLIRERHPDALAVIVGGKHEFEPEYEDFLRARIAEKGLENAVRMVGLQTNIPEWVQAMDVAIHASDTEPFGIVVIEAMALGKPMVAGDRGGPAEIITHEVNGLLSPFEDAPALARNVVRYLDDPAWAATVGAAARARALEFSARAYAENVIAAVRTFLARRA